MTYVLAADFDGIPSLIEGNEVERMIQEAVPYKATDEHLLADSNEVGIDEETIYEQEGDGSIEEETADEPQPSTTQNQGYYLHLMTLKVLTL